VFVNPPFPQAFFFFFFFHFSLSIISLSLSHLLYLPITFFIESCKKENWEKKSSPIVLETRKIFIHIFIPTSSSSFLSRKIIKMMVAREDQFTEIWKKIRTNKNHSTHSSYIISAAKTTKIWYVTWNFMKRATAHLIISSNDDNGEKRWKNWHVEAHEHVKHTHSRQRKLKDAH
jgi:hypothetical protein